MKTALILLCILVVLLLLALAGLRSRYNKLKKSLEEGRIIMSDALKDSEEDKTRLKRQLTQNVAHELKTPVSSIRGYLETLVNEPEMDGRTREMFIERCYSQSRRLSALVQDISMLNRLDDAPQTFDRESVGIAALLDMIRKETALQLREHDMKMQILVDSGVEVYGNGELVYSIFRNLTDNSIAYAGAGSVITVRGGEETPGEYRFIFSDNGVGVPQEHIPHLFERFYRVDKGRSRKLGGTGLGLAIVKNSVLLHHGSISVRLGKAGGLEFHFTLPKAEGDS